MAGQARTTECLFCSMCCTVSVAATPKGMMPAYEGMDDPRRCARGHYIAELLRLPDRLNKAVIERDGKHGPAPLKDAIALCAEKLAGTDVSSQASLIVDGNMTCEDIAAAGRLAERCLNKENCAVFLPPADEELLDGMFSVGFELPSGEAVSDSDAVLMIGDGIATHPMVARPVLDARNKARGNRLIVVDSVGGKSAKFATDVILTRPGGETAFLEAVAKSIPEIAAALGDVASSTDVAQLATKAGVTELDVKGVADVINGATAPIILVSSVTGRGVGYDRVGALCARIARGSGAKLLPLLAYGNGLGAYRIARSLGLGRTAGVLHHAREGQIRWLMCAGVDLSSALPAVIWKPIEEKVDFLAFMSPLPTPMQMSADVTLPCGLWCEANGTVLDWQQGVEHFMAIVPPVKGACRASEAFQQVANALTGSAEPLAGLEEEWLTGELQLSPKLRSAAAFELEDEKFKIVGDAGGIHFLDGAITRRLSWPRMIRRDAVAMMSVNDAESLGLTDGDTAVLRTAHGEAIVRVEVSATVPDGVIAALIHFDSVRGLFEWRVDAAEGRICALPVNGTIGKTNGNDGSH